LARAFTLTNTFAAPRDVASREKSHRCRFAWVDASNQETIARDREPRTGIRIADGLIARGVNRLTRNIYLRRSLSVIGKKSARKCRKIERPVERERRGGAREVGGGRIGDCRRERERFEKPTISSETSSIRENRGKGDISGGASRYEGFGGKPPSRRPVKERKKDLLPFARGFVRDVEACLSLSSWSDRPMNNTVPTGYAEILGTMINLESVGIDSRL